MPVFAERSSSSLYATCLRKLAAGIGEIQEGREEPEDVQITTFIDWLRATLPKGWSWKAPHLQAIAEHLDAVEAGEIDRLAIHMPPRHAKTETVTIRYPVLCLYRRPSDRILVTGYNERFARKLGRRVRNLAAGLRVPMADDKTASDEWYTRENGLVMARGVGSPPTGEGFNRILIDDPIRKREDADSETIREKTWDWYTDDLYTRLEPDGAIVLTMTRWHEDDVGARAVASEPGRWTILNLPAIAGGDDSIGRDIGEALWPDRYNLEALERIRTVMVREEGERSWQALFQQNPTPREGTLFRVGMIELVERDALPAVIKTGVNRWYEAWDLAATAGGGDWTACVDMAEADGFIYVDPLRFREEPYQRNKMIRQRCDLVKPRHVRVPQDPGAAGKESAQALIRLLAGHSVTATRDDGDKFVRAEPLASQVNAGNVRVVNGPHARDFIEELRVAPNGKNDDWIDAASACYNDLAKRAQAQRPAVAIRRN